MQVQQEKSRDNFMSMGEGNERICIINLRSVENCWGVTVDPHKKWSALNIAGPIIFLV